MTKHDPLSAARAAKVIQIASSEKQIENLQVATKATVVAESPEIVEINGEVFYRRGTGWHNLELGYLGLDTDLAKKCEQASEANKKPEEKNESA